MQRNTQFLFAPILFFALAAANAQVKFSGTSYLSGDIGSESIVSGDFNNDGTLDLVTINYSTLSFYRGLGAGKFADPVNQTVTGGANQVYAADFNNDGKLDLAIGGGGNTQGDSVITILLGNGDGTFTEGTNISPGGTAYFIFLADFNGDHKPDVVASVCSSSTCNTQVFLGQGNGTFKLSATLSYGGGQVVAGDFNADGYQDVAVLSGQNELAVYLGNGNGTFQNPMLASQPGAISLAVGDFYNDRIQSIAVMSTNYNSGNSIYYLATARVTGSSLQVTSPQLATNLDYFATIAAGDINGDFRDDIVLVGGNVRSSPYTLYMLGKGDGAFQNSVSLPAYGEGESFPFIRDLNLDSRHDIGTAWDATYGDDTGGAYVLLNTSASTNCNPPQANQLGLIICAPALGGLTLPATYTFKAAGNAFNGIAKRMELWIDGKKVGQNLEDQLKITTTLAAGSHLATFVVIDSFDSNTKESVPFTTQ